MSEDNGPVVRVTLGDIYKGQLEQSITLAEIKGSIALQSLQGQSGAVTLGDHETRIRKIETKVYALPGAATLIGLGALAVSFYKR